MLVFEIEKSEAMEMLDSRESFREDIGGLLFGGDFLDIDITVAVCISDEVVAALNVLRSGVLDVVFDVCVRRFRVRFEEDRAVALSFREI